MLLILFSFLIIKKVIAFDTPISLSNAYEPGNSSLLELKSFYNFILNL